MCRGGLNSDRWIWVDRQQNCSIWRDTCRYDTMNKILDDYACGVCDKDNCMSSDTIVGVGWLMAVDQFLQINYIADDMIVDMT